MIVMPAIYPIFNRLSLVNCSYFPDFVNSVPEKNNFIQNVFAELGSTQSWQTIRIDTRDKFSDFRFYLWPFGALSRSVGHRSKTNVALVLQSFAVSAFYYRV